METFPLTPSQMGILLACNKQPLSTCYNLPCAIPYPKEIVPERLAEAVRMVISARPGLRIHFVKEENGLVRQYADDAMAIPVSVAATDEAFVSQYIRHGFVRPFQLLGDNPLCRFEIFTTESHCWLLCDFHHIIADGITIAHLFFSRDLPAAYSGTLSADASSQNEMLFLEAEAETVALGQSAYQRDRDFFLSMFEQVEMTRLDVVEPTHRDVPDFDRPARSSACQYVNRGRVDEWCARHHAHPHAFLMTAFNIVLAKFCHTRQLAYATLYHGRHKRDLRNAYGMFVRTVPVVSVVNPKESVSQAVEDVQRQLFAVMRHHQYPFTHFCHDMQAAPGITFAFQGENILEQVAIDGKTAKGRQLERDQMDGELSCVVYTQQENYEIRTEAMWHHTPWADLVAQAMRDAVEYILCHPDMMMGDVDILGEKEKNEIMTLSQGGRMVVDFHRTWVDDFLDRVGDNPDNLAVADGTMTLTYGELDRWSAAVAQSLINESATSPYVGVEAVPCAAFAVAALAVMRAGKAYIPIDPHWPQQRRMDILKEAQVKVLLRPGDMCPPDADSHIDCINRAIPDAPAYVIYTSGTSSHPKGVVISHRALYNLVRFIVAEWRLTAKSRISCHSSLAFDASIEDLFPVLTTGGAVYVMPEEVRRDPEAIHRFIDQHQITGGCYTTALAPVLAGCRHPSLDYVCLGGEKLRRVPLMDCRVINTYGPTEFTVDSTYYTLTGNEDGDIPIGRPLPGNAAFVTDPFGMLLPKGVVGELCLHGVQMASGYLHDQTLTAERFTDARFIEGKVYHTGDLAWWDEAGMLHYVTRQDRQVKVNGFRVAMDEVEDYIASLTDVGQVAVCPMTIGKHEVLCAFFSADRELSENELSVALRDRCPEYMIPSLFVQLEHFPLTSTGKTDYRKLQRMPMRERTEYRAPQNALEAVLCHIFSKVLEMENVGATDDFFQLGGTSIAVMQVMAEAEKAGVQMAYGDVFQCPTPQALARKVEGNFNPEDIDLTKYDYAPLHRFLSEPDEQDTLPPLHDIHGRILMTGATGFLGAHVLHQLMGQGDSTVCCVVRAATPLLAWERMEKTWRYYFDRPLPVHVRKRMEVVVGDLADQRLLTTLEEKEMEMVIHCAADVRHFAPGDTLMDVNTNAVARLADYCLAHGLPMVHVSTLSVAGFSPSGKPLTLTDRELYIGQQFREHYSLTKFMAERVLLERMATHGLKALIVRVGNLSPRLTDGRFLRNPERNTFTMAMRMMAAEGVMPQAAADVEVDVSPVDVVARELFDLLDDGVAVGVTHLSHPCPGGIPHLLKSLTNNPIRMIDDEAFRQRFSHLLPIILF